MNVVSLQSLSSGFLVVRLDGYSSHNGEPFQYFNISIFQYFNISIFFKIKTCLNFPKL